MKAEHINMIDWLMTLGWLQLDSCRIEWPKVGNIWICLGKVATTRVQHWLRAVGILEGNCSSWGYSDHATNWKHHDFWKRLTFPLKIFITFHSDGIKRHSKIFAIVFPTNQVTLNSPLLSYVWVPSWYACLAQSDALRRRAQLEVLAQVSSAQRVSKNSRRVWPAFPTGELSSLKVSQLSNMRRTSETKSSLDLYLRKKLSSC